MVVHWLGLGVFTAKGLVQFLVRKLRSHKPLEPKQNFFQEKNKEKLLWSKHSKNVK